MDNAHNLASPPDPSTTPLRPSTGYAPINEELDEIDLGGRKLPTPARWTDILAVPVLGAAYFVHWRYRRYAPRRIPTLTSLRLGELYGTAGAAWTVIREADRLQAVTMQDRDLMTIEASAWMMRMAYNECKNSEDFILPDQLKTNESRNAAYPSNGDLAARLRWWYNHYWSGPVEWNLVLRLVARQFVDMAEAKSISTEDVEVCITHIANVMSEPGDDELYIQRAEPFADALCWVTPLAILARWAGRRVFWLPLNAVQRALFYATVAVASVQHYQHASYLSTIQDKRSAAYMIRRAFGPNVDKVVDHWMRKRGQ